MSREYPSDWNSRRKAVYQRDNFTCQNCGRRGGPHGDYELHAHHIVPKSKGGSHRKSNLKTLCKQCHNAIHGKRLAPTGGGYRRSSNRNKPDSKEVENNFIEKKVTEFMIKYPILGAVAGCFSISIFIYLFTKDALGWNLSAFILIMALLLSLYGGICYLAGVSSVEELKNHHEESLK